MRLNGQQIEYCTVHCISITLIIQHQSFLAVTTLFKNFDELVDFFNVTNDSLAKKLGHPA